MRLTVSKPWLNGVSMGLPDTPLQPNFRSTIFQRLFWCAFLATALGVTVAGILLHWPFRLELLLGAGGAAISLGLAFVLSWPVDRRIARMRKFAEGLLEA